MKNFTRIAHHFSLSEREQCQGHTGAVIWLTGLSGSGKSTLAMGMEQRLFVSGYNVYTLDGDNVRHGLNSDLGFSLEDRHENVRRAGEVAALFAEAGFICISSFISPTKIDRDNARKALSTGLFCEVYVKASLTECKKRDPKGLYRKARSGLIADMTGINSPYEPPETSELVIETAQYDIETCIDILVNYVVQNTKISSQITNLNTATKVNDVTRIESKE